MANDAESNAPLQGIPYPYLHHVNAALGWLELGAPAEAALELDQVTFQTLGRHEVILLRWKICARLENWPLALHLARTLVRQGPDRPASWLCLAFSLVHVQGAFDAWQELLEAARKHPRISAVPVFLSRLCSQLSDRQKSALWLKRWEQLEREAARLKREPAAKLSPEPPVLVEAGPAAGTQTATGAAAPSQRVSF
jgi:predicted Zn-dependent protease